MIGFIAAGLLSISVQSSGHSVPPGLPVIRNSTERLKFMDGVWIGDAWRLDPTGVKRDFIQMERVGPMMGGEIRLMEGKGKLPNGRAFFNAFTVFSEPKPGKIEMRSYVFGHMMARELEILPGGGFRWEGDEGPVRVRYTATIRDGVWHEIGERLQASGAPEKIFEMRLKRVADTKWPAENPHFPAR